jgi:hypothetical protein
MPQQSRAPVPVPTANGWVVEVSMPRLHASEPVQMLFAVAIEDARGAVDAVRRVSGGLRCVIEAKCRLSPRALTQLAVPPGDVKSF